MNMKGLFATFIGSMILTVGHAQVTISVDVEGPSSNTECDGVLTITVDGAGEVTGVSQIFGWTHDYVTNPQGVTRDSLCVVQPAGAPNTSGKIENDSCFTIGIGVLSGYLNPIFQPNEQISYTIVCQLPSNETATDGSLEVTGITIGQNDVDFYRGNALPTVNALSANDSYPGADSIGTGLSIGGLGPDLYMIRIENYDIPTNTRASSIAIGLEPWSTMGCQDSIGIIPTVTGVSSPTVCDGAVSCEGWGSVPPYEFYHHTIGVWGADQSGLCEGLHVVEIVDQINNSAFESYIIPAPENTLNSFDWPYAPGLDTLFASATENCDLDFNLPIDSFFIDQVLFIDSSAIQSIWHFYQNGEVFTITQDFAIDELTPSVLALGVYCENGRAAALGYYYVYDDFNMSEVGFVDINEERTEKIRIAPNPNSGLFEVSGIDKGSTLIITDLSGRTLISEMSTIGTKTFLDISKFGNGVYVLQVLSNAQKITKRIIVN